MFWADGFWANGFWANDFWLGFGSDIGSGSWDDIYWDDPNKKKERKNIVTRSQALDVVES